ncbi:MULTISPECIES: DUF4956 domain-containing protein [unclassified Butyrivibrio]|uniref:DUF4956 domain-containing protein n=1 Tax=unclassified Butyrivibrio TaxID=2639466 RepID=UPI0003FB82A1|nr:MULTISPECIES: DUF4956 domain-containing protein [unclassified Butyrivibrio]SCY72201.1 protein of unknown function [Butyrivibrio sp. INlla14]
MTTDLIFGTIMTSGTISGVSFIIATLCSLVIGCFIAFMYTLKNNYSKSYIVTLALLPAIVQVVIMLVNGNIGAGVAVAGAFSLVRFRSAPGTGKEITSIFLAMAVGLATGMGYIGIAAIFAVIITLANLLLSSLSFKGIGLEEKTLKITVPESLDFEGIFDDIFMRYTNTANLEEVKTSGMGSLYKLTYKVVLRDKASTKGMIDEIRQRNGNLEVTCSRPVMVKAEEL